jgi:hypothetical protein
MRVVQEISEAEDDTWMETALPTYVDAASGAKVWGSRVCTVWPAPRRNIDTAVSEPSTTVAIRALQPLPIGFTALSLQLLP